MKLPISFATAVTAVCAAMACAAFAAEPPLPAFPGAEGFGAGATGGRGKPVYEVTNLADDGPGSLRDALREGDRTVVFRVSGTIDLAKRLELRKPNVTLAGQTAPGDGICLRGRELLISDCDNVIVRFLRFRPGDEQKVEADALSIRNSRNVIVDHCSMSWSTDSLNDVTHRSGNVTVQWCILSEPLNSSVHVKGAHGYATGWDGRIIDDPAGGKTGGGGSYHHNLIAHAVSRAPRIGYYKEGRGLIDCRNNVIYNCGPSYGGETDDLNFIANYYRPGPSNLRPAPVLFEVWAADTRMYVADNVYEGQPHVTANNRAAIAFKGTTAGGRANHGPAENCLVDKPFAVAQVFTHHAEEALGRVLKQSGATLPTRDAVDERIVDDVTNRTGGIINSQADVGGWPELRSVGAPADGDHDGMPDEWETRRGLDPENPQDGRATAKQQGEYTNLEIYLNELAEMAPVRPTGSDQKATTRPSSAD